MTPVALNALDVASPSRIKHLALAAHDTLSVSIAKSVHTMHLVFRVCLDDRINISRHLKLAPLTWRMSAYAVVTVAGLQHFPTDVASESLLRVKTSLRQLVSHSVM